MYYLIYDYIGESDSCYGIEESFDTWQEAYDRKEELKNNWDYCNFDISYTPLDYALTREVENEDDFLF